MLSSFTKEFGKIYIHTATVNSSSKTNQFDWFNNFHLLPGQMCATSTLDFRFFKKTWDAKWISMPRNGFPLLFYREVWKRICKLVSMTSNHCLLIIRHVSSKLLFLEQFVKARVKAPVFHISPKTVKKENPRTDFLWFHVLLNPKSGYPNMNLACPIKSTLSHYFPCVVIIGRLWHVDLS